MKEITVGKFFLPVGILNIFSGSGNTKDRTEAGKQAGVERPMRDVTPKTLLIGEGVKWQKRPDWWFRMNLRKGKYKIVYPRLARKTFAHGKYKVKERTA